MSLKYIPNILTVFRVVITPVFIILFLSPNFLNKLISLLLFFIGSITDYLDGYIARKYNYITDFGKLIDPLADKIFVVSAFVLLHLLYPESIKLWMIIAIILRDVFVTLYRYVLMKNNIILKTSYFAKRKTLLQIIIIHILLIYHAFYNDIAFSSLNNFNFAIYILMTVCTVLTILTGIHYIVINNSK